MVRREPDGLRRHLEALGREGDEARLDRRGRRLGGLAVEIGAARGGGRRRVRDLGRIGRRYSYPVEIEAELARDDLGDLGEEALPHLGAAVVQQHAAVGVDVHQGTRLVVERGGERDAELHRRHRDAALHHRARRVPGADRCAPRRVVRGRRELVEEAVGDEVLDPHVVGRDVAPRRVEVRAANGDRVEVERARDLVQHVLDRHHPLRATKATEGGVRLRVRLAAVRDDPHRRQPVGVVGVHHRAVVDRAAQVGREPAARGEHDVDSRDPPDAVETDLVLDQIVVALAGDRDVVVAVVAKLHRASGHPRGERGGARRMRGLRLLAAKSTAHPPALDADPVRLHAERVGDLELHLARVLGRAVDEHVAVFPRHGVRHLALEVELLLAADAKAALQPVRRGGKRRLPVTALERDRGDHERLLRERVLDGEDRRQVLVLDDGEPRRPARRIDRLGDDEEDRLADELHFVGGEDRIVVQDRPDVVLARNVRGGEDRHDAGRGAHGGEVHRPDAGVGAPGQPECGVERAASLEDVVGVRRLARDVQVRAVVAYRLAGGAAGGRFASRRSRVVHAGTPPRSYSRLGRPASAPEVSRWNLRSRFCATVER